MPSSISRAASPCPRAPAAVATRPIARVAPSSSTRIVASDLAVRLEPQVHGRRLDVPAVELGIGALLLDDEDVDPQPAQPVDLERRQLGEAAPGAGGESSCSQL